MESLRERLIAFRAAYYRVQVLRGLLLVGLGSLGMWAVLSLAEGVFWWESSIRKILWGAWITASVGMLSVWVVYPLLQYGLRLRGYLSDEEAARWIGKRIPQIQDKLLNTFQLSQQNPSQNAAILLAIEERMQQLSVFSWEITLPYPQVRQYALGLLLLLIGIVSLWMGLPTTFREGAYRFMQPRKEFIRPLPFTLKMEGLKKFYRIGENLEIFLTFSGKELPERVWIESDQGEVPLQKTNFSHYVLRIPSLQESFKMRIYAEGSLIAAQFIEVLRPSHLQTPILYCNYPAYTNRKPDTLYAPQIRVLRGSRLQLSAQVESDRPYRLHFSGGTLHTTAPHQWHAQFTAYEPHTYLLVLQDSFFTDTFSMQVDVTLDYHPTVQLLTELFQSETWEHTLRLQAADDYGISRGVLWYRIAESSVPGRTQQHFNAYPLTLPSSTSLDQLIQLNWKYLGIQAGDKVEYYAEVWDNDALYGPKSSRSILYTLELADEVAKQETFAQMQDSLLEIIKHLNKQVERSVGDTQAQESSSKVSDFMERFRDVRSELRSMQRLATEQQLFSPELLQQMEQLLKILESFNPQKLEQLATQIQSNRHQDSSRIAQLHKELQQAYQEWQQKMERLEALLPEIQQQRRLEQLMTRIAELSDQQKKLSELSDSLHKQPSTQEVQRNLLDKTAEVAKELDSLRRLYQDRPILRDSLRSARQSIENALQKMQEALDRLQQNRGNSARISQENAAQNLEEALSALDSGAMAQEEEEQAEEYEALRLLLKAVLSLSFRQEDLRKKTQDVASLGVITPLLITQQQRIRQDYRQVHDSLHAIAMRSPAVEEPIMDLLREIERYFQAMSFQQAEVLLRRQQYILQGMNRLANLFTELLAQLESQRQKSCNSGACSNPFRVRRKNASSSCSRPSSSGQPRANSTPPSRSRSGMQPSLQQLQQQLNELLERATQPNPAAETSLPALSPEERARLSTQQELIRLRLQERLRQDPGSASQLQGLIEEMQKAEKDILIGNLTQERLMRQQAILTRLLEYEQSQHERELEPQRESRTAKQFFQRVTSTYPTPRPSQQAPATIPAPWLYQPSYQNLIQKYLQYR
ncbi:MAG: hypothetical protein NZ580_01500 [Bacteroidia bacterium]|nr:hypothetical protein [Bacteroidia bacterium]MDW8235365.1 DUF4175 family protein [Bacteroidia bacterium]